MGSAVSPLESLPSLVALVSVIPLVVGALVDVGGSPVSDVDEAAGPVEDDVLIDELPPSVALVPSVGFPHPIIAARNTGVAL